MDEPRDRSEPGSDRAEIAAILEDSIGDGSSPEEVRASWLAEVRRRREAIERGEETLEEFDVVMDELRARRADMRVRLSSRATLDLYEVEASELAEANRRLESYRSGESIPVDPDEAMRVLESKQRRPPSTPDTRV